MNLERSLRNKIGLGVLVTLIVIAMIAPIYIMVIMSVGDPQETFATQDPRWVISGIDRAEPGEQDYTGTGWDNLPRWWTRVLTEPAPGGGVQLDEDLITRTGKSLRVAFMTTGVALLIAVPAAYSISRINPRLKYALILFLFISRIYPDVGLALPVSITFLRINAETPISFYDTVFGLELVAAHLLLALPLATWVLVGTFDSIPTSLEEQAHIDGASRLTTLRRILIPLATPGIAVAGLFAWLASWEEVTYALFLTLQNRTLPTEIINILRFSPPPVIATYALIVTVPVVILTYVFGRRIQSGLLAGAVKG